MSEEWTVNTLKQYFEQRFDDSNRATSAALAAAKEAVLKAEASSETRFQSVNEFRNTLSDQQRNLMPRSEVEILIKSMNEKIELLKLQDVSTQGRSAGVSASWGLLLGIVALVSAIIAIISRFV